MKGIGKFPTSRFLEKIACVYTHALLASIGNINFQYWLVDLKFTIGKEFFMENFAFCGFKKYILKREARSEKRFKEKCLVKLYKILVPYAGWRDDITPEENETAKQSLALFGALIRQEKPTSPLKPYGALPSKSYHLQYTRYIFNMYDAFIQKRYDRVCHELHDMVYFEIILQPNVYNNVQHILRLFLEESS